MTAALRTPDLFAPVTRDDVSRAIRKGPTRTVVAGPSRIATWRFGAGPDLLFIHGWPLHAATWRAIVPALSRHFTCHLIDLPFAGQTSTPLRARLGLPGYVDAIETVADTLDLRVYGMVAHDSGALMARELAARHGDRVRALVLGNTEIPAHVPWQMAVYLALGRLPGGPRLLGWSMRSRLVRRSALGFGVCFEDAAFMDGDFGEWFVRPLQTGDDHGQLNLLRDFDSSAVSGLKQVHARIAAPVRLVWGTDDTFFPLAKAEAMLDQFAGPADLRTIEGAKLFGHEDHPEAFVGACLPFLEKHLGRRIPAQNAD
jgi:pimeloyl-ACP methyl ester carboxylesterase